MKNSSLIRLCESNSQTKNERRYHWLQKTATLLILVFFNFSLVMAQDLTVKGTITDASDGLSIPGASVIVKGTTNGTVTDLNGNYSLKVASGDLLVFSYVGMKSQEIVASSAIINVVLATDQTNIDEVVVVGYGVQKKSVVTAAISSVKGDVLVQTASTGTISTALQGQTSGVTVLPTSGAPGAPTKIRIRGAGSNGNSNPLYIVDGLKVSTIDDIDPNDIESMEVLKDGASAAIYGTEGANGVILITTKVGFKGESRVNYSFKYGIQNMSSNAELMNAQQYTQFMTEAGETVANTEGYDTDWLDAISQSAPMQQHSLSFAGGTDKTSYYLSGSYLTQDGAIGGSNANFERFTFRINTKSQVKSWLSVGNNINYSHSTRQALPEDDEYRSIVNSALLMDPFTPVLEKGLTPAIQTNIANGKTVLQNANGQYYGLNRVVTGETANPVAFLENTHNSIETDRLTAMFFATITPLKGLNITSRGGLELENETQNNWNQKYFFSSERSSDVNMVEDKLYKNQRGLWENFASYNKQIDRHNMTGLVGMSYEDITRPNYRLYSQMPKEGAQYAYHDYSINKETNRVGGTLEELTKISYFGRLSYDYANKYMVEGSARRDGASNLPAENTWANFYALSGGWLISQEDFWPLDAINYFKARASWGQNGSIANVISFSDREAWVSKDIQYPDVDGNLLQGSRIYSPTNPDLSWEKSAQTNFGIDLRALNSRLNFSLDYFIKDTEGLIIPDSPARSVGYYNVPSVNGGTIRNNGWEIETGWTSLTSSGLKYGISLNITKIQNEVIALASETPFPGASVRGNTLTYFEKGAPIWYFQGYKTNGIDPTTGNVIVVDVNEDGKISDADLTNIGSPHPDYMFGLNLSAEYKGFDVNVFMQGMAGNDVYMAWFRTDRATTNKPAYFFTDRWTPENPSASMPKPTNGDKYLYQSDLMVQDASFIRIKQIQLGYTVPKSLSGKIGLESVRGYVSLNDYFTFTQYQGMDPEAGSSSDNRQGIDKGLYPLTKKFMFGLNVSF